MYVPAARNGDASVDDPSSATSRRAQMAPQRRVILPSESWQRSGSHDQRGNSLRTRTPHHDIEVRAAKQERQYLRSVARLKRH
ncbi:hypothetical protein Pmani_036933 [Petrolisthes manimaculis]|uniref:Uncharacterized protein n=1 Tax=Petrolisthes manimaculis TaxID=1843537 RepID=A0AAE1TM73_9EUCA|nr:hypothetical protein Pmani_036933 [Petrolisthes manimaculis]